MQAYQLAVNIEEPKGSGKMRTYYYVITMPAGMAEAESMALAQLRKSYPDHRIDVDYVRPLRRRAWGLSALLSRWGVSE